MTSVSSRRSRWRRIVVALAVVVALVTLVSWAARDLPRRWLERRLAKALEAEVRLARLEIDGLRHFVLHRLEIRRPGWEPRLESVEIDRLDVESSIREVLRERYEALTVDGVQVRVVPPSRPVEPLPESAMVVRRIEIRHGRIVAVAEGRETRIDFDATLRDWGAEPTGEASLTAERLDTALLTGIIGSDGASLSATAEDLRIDGELLRGPSGLRARASAESVEVRYAERTFDLVQPRIEANARHDESNGNIRLTAEPVVTGIESARLEASLDAESYAVLDGRVELQGIAIGEVLPLPEAWVLDGTADVEAHTDDGETVVYDGKADLGRVEIGSMVGREIRARVRGSWRASTTLAYDIDATLASVSVISDTAEFNGGDMVITASGDLDPTSGGGVVARLELPRGAGSFGETHLPPELFPLEIETDGRLTTEPNPALDGTAVLVSPALGTVRVEGLAESPAAGPRARLRWEWGTAPDLADLLEVAGPWESISLRGRPRASGTIEGVLRDPAVRGRVAVESLEIAEAGWGLTAGSVSASFRRDTGDRGRIELDEVEIAGELGQTSPAWSRPAKLTASGRFDPLEETATLDGSRLEISGLAELLVGAERRADGSIAATLETKPIELSPLRELSRVWFDDPYPEHTLKGSIDGRLAAWLEPDRGWKVEGEVRLDGAGFSSPDGSRVVEGTEGSWRLRMLGGRDGRLEGSATGMLTGPVMLWGTLFGDFSPLSAELDLTLTEDADAWSAMAVCKLPHEVTVTARLAPGIDYALDASVPDLAAFLEHYVRIPFEGSVENIDTLGATGALHVGLEGSVDDERRTVAGTVTATDASFSGALGETAIDDLDLSVPLALEWRTRADGARVLVEAEQRTGSLSYGRLLLSGVELPPLETGLSVSADTIRLDRPLRLEMFDGHVNLHEVALAEWSRPSRHLRFGLGLDGLSLEALTTSLGTVPLEGALEGGFPAVRLTPDYLQVDGGGTIRVFGGDVEVYDISGEDVLSRFPKLRFSAKLEGIRLLELTRTFDFGEVYGVAQGAIRDCELFRGVPVRCEAEVHTVETRGVPRKISVKAVRNISILGSGDRVGFLDRGIQRFFDTYTYSKIGITMELRNDRFVLRGTERRGNRELFVKGRLPFRIDIVNVAPGQGVSFQTMLSRLEDLEIGPAPGKR